MMRVIWGELFFNGPSQRECGLSELGWDPGTWFLKFFQLQLALSITLVSGIQQSDQTFIELTR